MHEVIRKGEVGMKEGRRKGYVGHEGGKKEGICWA